MRCIPSIIPAVLVIEPDVHRDSRGIFVETYHAEKYRASGITAVFVQDNHTRSVTGTLRGLHMQRRKPQAKLIRVIAGEIFDVAVDLRRGSSDLRPLGRRGAVGGQLQAVLHPGRLCPRLLCADGARPKSSTNAATSTTPPTNSASRGTTPPWRSRGPSAIHCCQTGTWPTRPWPSLATRFRAIASTFPRQICKCGAEAVRSHGRRPQISGKLTGYAHCLLWLQVAGLLRQVP